MRKDRPRLVYDGPLRRVLFLRRPNRFLAVVEDAGGQRWEAHVPNPGRLRELLRPGVTHGYVAPAPSRHDPRPPGAPMARRTAWTLVSVEFPPSSRRLVSIDTRAAAPMVADALRRGFLPPLDGWGEWRSEVFWGPHRYDHAVPGPNSRSRPRAILEVKSSNLREGRTALFPDAPTSRGTAHVDGLRQFVRGGGQAALLFLVQRQDVEEVRPYGAMDPDFAHACERASRAGVRFLARTLEVRPEGAVWGRPLPVRLPRWEPARDLEGARARRNLHSPRPPVARAKA